MADPLAAALAPEALETGIERALARAIESGAPALVLPVGHLGYLAGSDVDTSEWHLGPEGKPYNDGQRVVICTGPKDKAHRCIASEARGRIRQRSSSLAVAREPMVAAYLDKLAEDDPSGYYADRYIFRLLGWVG